MLHFGDGSPGKITCSPHLLGGFRRAPRLGPASGCGLASATWDPTCTSEGARAGGAKPGLAGGAKPELAGSAESELAGCCDWAGCCCGDGDTSDGDISDGEKSNGERSGGERSDGDMSDGNIREGEGGTERGDTQPPSGTCGCCRCCFCCCCCCCCCSTAWLLLLRVTLLRVSLLRVSRAPPAACVASGTGRRPELSGEMTFESK